jgi:lipopolysaccharide/colanic/teichoic acid biosynthesis glycosyltransferase
MSKQPLRFSNTNPSQAHIWQLAGGRFFSLIILLLLVVSAWLFVERALGTGLAPLGLVAGVVILSTVLTLAIERSLVYLPLSTSWRYRLAFLGSPLVFFGIWIALPQEVGIGWAFASLLGGFLGGILATSFSERLWENNSPPSAEVMLDVYQLHLDEIGEPDSTPVLKRAFDLFMAMVGLLISLPVWGVSIFLIWIEDPGPLLFVKNSVGKGGMNFHQFKLRTMVRGAEETTGPVLASEEDERVLKVGVILRKTALDELPQLLNILRGEMSFVGPRPQRTVLVQEYLRDIPKYAQRHRVLPGLSGLAQVAGDYYLTPRGKLRFDRLYIEHTGLGFDLKLLFLAFLITFWYRWQADWDGRLPRSWLRVGARSHKTN